MKRIIAISILSALVVATMMLGTSCGNTKAFVGDWELYSIEDDAGNAMPGGAEFSKGSITLREDGSGYVVLKRKNSDTGEQAEAVTWEKRDEGVEITGNGFVWIAQINEDTLAVDSHGVDNYAKMVFVKKEAMDQSLEKADEYYRMANGVFLCRFLDNGIYCEDSADNPSYFCEATEDGYKITIPATDKKDAQEIVLTASTDPDAGDVLMNGDEVWAYKNKDGAEKAFYEGIGKYVGTWEAIEINSSGMAMSPDDVGLDFKLVISEDGTLAATTNGEDDGKGNWQETEDGIKITDGTRTEISGKLDGKKLVVSFGDDFIVTMKKVK